MQLYQHLILGIFNISPGLKHNLELLVAMATHGIEQQANITFQQYQKAGEIWKMEIGFSSLKIHHQDGSDGAMDHAQVKQLLYFNLIIGSTLMMNTLDSFGMSPMMLEPVRIMTDSLMITKLGMIHTSPGPFLQVKHSHLQTLSRLFLQLSALITVKHAIH